MAIVTFMSDYGWKDHYVAVVKASILKVNPNLNIVDIGHDINTFDIGHAAYVLKHSYNHFPEKTVHLVCVDSVDRPGSKLIAIELNNHFFVGFDSGLFSLLGHSKFRIGVELNSVKPIQTVFAGKEILGPVAAELATGKDLADMGNPIFEMKTLFSRQLKATKREIVGNVIRIDSYGNLITNITKQEFDNVQKVNNQAPFDVQVGREVFTHFHENYTEVDSGDCFLIFNSSGLLQIGINKGNASELLGLRLDVPISINFKL